MSNSLLVKLAQKKYEKRRKKVNEFIDKFRDENSVRIKEVSNHNKDILIQDIKEVCYRNQDLMTNDEIVKLIVLMDKLSK